MDVNIREIREEDIPLAGKYIYEAFCGIADQHNFPHDFPSDEVTTGFAHMLVVHPQIFGVAAEIDGRFVGSNFMTEFDPIRGVGPITVDPNVQARGVGRKLMEAVIDRGKDAAGIRLVQDAFNTRSMSLYASLGFDIKEPLALMNGRPQGEMSKDILVRRMTSEDIAECSALCERIHGFARRGELELSLAAYTPFVAERDGRIVAYAATVTTWSLNHGVAETDQDMYDLLIGASAELDQPVSFLLPTRQAGFHRWALAAGLKMVKPMSLMAMGEYKEPDGCYFTSVLY